MGEDWDSTGETNAQQRYMAGVYDVICDSCEGTGKVKCPQFKEMPRIERKAYIQFLRAEREERDFEHMSRAEIEAERRIGA